MKLVAIIFVVFMIFILIAFKINQFISIFTVSVHDKSSFGNTSQGFPLLSSNPI